MRGEPKTEALPAVEVNAYRAAPQLPALGVGLFAAVSCRLYHEGLGSLAASLYRTTGGTALAHFAAFLLPTTLMGMSLPLLVRATVRETASASRVIGALYGINVSGEGGEYETFVADMPLFSKRIRILDSKSKWVRNSGTWVIKKVELSEKALQPIK